MKPKEEPVDEPLSPQEINARLEQALAAWLIIIFFTL